MAHPHIDIGGEIGEPPSDRIQGHLSYDVQSRRLAMSMKPQPIPEIPPETFRVVRAVFPKGNLYIHLLDTLGSIYQDELFVDLYPERGQPAYARLSPGFSHHLPVHGESDRSTSC